MATQTTPKAKTKTTKKTAAKSVKATSSRGTKTAKATTKKSTTSKAVAKPVKTNKKDWFSLRNLHLLSALLFAGLTALAVTMMSSAANTLSIGYMGSDELASRGSTVFTPASQPIFDVEIRWLVVAVLVVSIVLPLLYATKLRGWYTRALAARTVSLRWIDVAVTGAWMTTIVAALSGVDEIMTLKLIGGLVVVSATLGWVAEKRNVQAGRPVMSEYVISLVSGLLPWILIASYAIATYMYGLIRYPWYVYALYAAVFGGSLLMALNHLQLHRRFKRAADYLKAERNYVLINLLTKTAFAVILIVGLQR